MKDCNYYNVFIAIADDSTTTIAEIPEPKKDGKTIALMQYELIANHPYRYTQEDVLFSVYAERNHIPEGDREEARKRFFSKGQPCLRTSALGKRYGWGMHHDAQGRVALYPVDSEQYSELVRNSSLTQLKALRSKR